MGSADRRAIWLAAACAVMTVSGSARAVDVGVIPTKLIVVDKLTASGKAKTVFVTKDVHVAKGTGTDVADIAVTFDVVYANGSAAGSFVLPQGDAGWLVNKDTVAKFVNKAAPGGSTEAKVAVIKPGKLAKLVGKGLGDTPLDILGAGDPDGTVYTSYCVTNGGDETCMCSAFTGCAYSPIAGGTGAKLACREGTDDPSCQAKCGGGSCANYVWGVTNFGDCSALCGGGIQLRAVFCLDTVASVIVMDGFCAGAGPKPPTAVPCNTDPC